MDIPKHWHKVPLHELIIVQKGVKPKNLKNKEFENSLPYLDVEGVEKGIIKLYADGLSAVKSNDDDIFVLRTGGRNGLVLKGKSGAVGSTFFCITPILINKTFLFNFLKSTEFSHSGSRDLNNSFWDLKVPLPPKEEQNRIVEILEIRLNEYRNNFENVKNEIENKTRSRKSILDAAISGKLTESWRFNHDYKLENLVTIPSEWNLVKMDQVIGNIESGKSFMCAERVPNKNEIGVLKVSAVSWGKYDENESKTCLNSQMINPNIIIRKDDFLLSRSNTTELVGACVIAESVSKRIMLSDKILRLTFINALPKYILYFLRSSWGRFQIEEFAKGAQESMKNISQENLKKIQVPLPTMEEQIEIVSQVDRLFLGIDEIEKQYVLESERSKQLQKSVLQSAYSGQLSSPLPNDTPVLNLIESVKLEKIKAEKELIKLKNNFRMTNKKVSEKMGLIEILEKTKDELTIEELFIDSHQTSVHAFYKELREISGDIQITKSDLVPEGKVTIKLNEL